MLTPPFLVAAGLLVLAGASKLRDPSLRRRALGALECALGLACVLVPAPPLAAALAALYAAFAGYLVWLRRAAPGSSCDCFGVEERPVGVAHVALDVAAAAVAGLAAVFRPVGLAEYASDHPLAAAPFVAGAAASVYLAYTAIVVGPDLVRELRA